MKVPTNSVIVVLLYGFTIFLDIAYSKDVDSTIKPSKLRVAGENAFSKGDLKLAMKYFNQLIDIEPNNESNYYKRFRVFLSERKYSSAIKDLTSAIAVNPSFERGYSQRGKLRLMIGECDEAAADYKKALELKPNDEKLYEKWMNSQTCSQLINQAEEAQKIGDYNAVHQALSQIIDSYAVSSSKLLLERAQTSISLGNVFDAIADSGRVLKVDSNNIPALLLRGQAYYSLGDKQSLEASMQHYRQGLHSDPEHKGLKSEYRKIKKLLKYFKNAENSIEAQEYQEALEDLEMALGVDPQHDSMNKELYFKKCSCHLKLEEGKNAQLACTQVIEIEDSYALAHAKLGDALLLLEDYEEAVREYKRAHELDEGNQEIQEGLRKAEAALKQSKTKNYYKILEVSRTATVKIIKRAYRKKALEWHPDKHADAGEEAQDIARKKFQDIAEAYEILSDEDLRARYDRGEDVSGNGQQQSHQHNPFGRGGHQFFQQGGRTFHFSFG